MGSTEPITDPSLFTITTPSLFSLNNRTIIGKLSQTLSQEAILECGGDVIAIDAHEIPLATTWEPLKALAKSLSRTLVYHACDITSPSLLETTFQTAASEVQHPLRGLVNCAGVGTVGESINYPESQTRQTLDVNLAGSLYVAQAAAKVVRRQFQEGKSLGASFVFIASMSGYIANKATPTAIYCASKAGVHQLTRSLAAEWGSPSSSLASFSSSLDDAAASSGPVIRVNSISPGVISTPMTQQVLARQDWTSTWQEEAMLKRISTPDEYRGAVAFLLGDASSYITGTDLRVDGGSTGW
ncbi:NAD(P)-binding protein [Trichoderma citrinoviride]|uniref:NAD(P)-binding protein n=1 Tax=Trichoderma citrinoviride TaxID=58853 RepID=A0A2T4B1H0_9HYPO|nr:NAD(P)-binding protein [Trichoderma citrinoviride]PTB63175.1 NAD(P)-binding protein [Trichoderma citrinoviride]